MIENISALSLTADGRRAVTSKRTVAVTSDEAQKVRRCVSGAADNAQNMRSYRPMVGSWFVAPRFLANSIVNVV